jgi:amino acid transporter
MTAAPEAPALRRVLRVPDLVFFYITAVVGMRWVATAAAAGPSALIIWVLAAACFFVPLAFTTIELSSRYPGEGGIYVWVKEAFGEFAGFLTGWTYWGSNLTYLPGLLYFAASTVLYMFGTRFMHLQSNPTYFIAVAVGGLLVATALNVVGLQVGKWFSTVGAVATWVPMALLIGMGLTAWYRFGAATPITAASLVPTTSVRDMVFWATIAFAFAGLEAGSFLGDEIVDPRRSITRAITIAGVIIAAIYILGTLAVLLALPQAQITGLGGFMDAMVAAGTRIGTGGLVPVTALLVTLASLGGVGVWLAATARLLFVAGIDCYLPRSFGMVHPHFHSPHRALMLQSFIAIVCAVLGQAGETPKQAYDILVNLGVVGIFLPYIAMFLAMLALQRQPAGPDVIRPPGGKPTSIVVGLLGLGTSAAAVMLACVPPAGESEPRRYVIKVVGLSLLLVGAGVLAFVVGTVRRRAELSALSAAQSR